MNSQLEQVLKQTNSRLSIGNKWLVWSITFNEWVVLEHKYYAHTNTTLYSGQSLDQALESLLKEEE
jgi:hypothetical protein